MEKRASGNVNILSFLQETTVSTLTATLSAAISKVNGVISQNLSTECSKLFN